MKRNIVWNLVFLALLALLFGSFLFLLCGCAVQNNNEWERPPYNFRWDMPDGYVVTDISTSGDGMIVKITKAEDPGPRSAYKIWLVEGGNSK